MYFDILDTTIFVSNIIVSHICNVLKKFYFSQNLCILSGFSALKNRLIVSIMIKKIFAINVEPIASKLQFYIFKYNNTIN